MRLVFAGTPTVAAYTLTYLLDHTDHEVVAVVSRPDAPRGRSGRPVPSPVSLIAGERGIDLLTPARLSEPGFADRLSELAPDCCPVVAYGALIPAAVLAIPAHGWVNVHYSLLPRWRGAAPVQRALAAGDSVTGVSVFRVVAALDAGPVYATDELPIGPDETAGDLLNRLRPVGARLLADVLDRLAAGTATATEQAPTGVTQAPKLTVAEAKLDWTLTAAELARQVLACNPAPMAWTTWSAERFRVLRATPAEAAGLGPGEFRADRGAVTVGTGSGSLRLLEVQPQGKRPMSAAAWANGLRERTGELR